MFRGYGAGVSAVTSIGFFIYFFKGLRGFNFFKQGLIDASVFSKPSLITHF
jgi:hypothetical protein